MEDLDEDEEDRKHLEYEKKIDSLMSEVGNLKTEVRLLFCDWLNMALCIPW